jgi:hypothetical protein
MNRRQLALFATALAARAQQPALASKTYKYEDLPARPSGNGQNKSRPVLDGKTHTGFRVEMHETELGPGLAPHPPHSHVHEEMVIVNEGTIEVTIGTGRRLGRLRRIEHRTRLAQHRQNPRPLLHPHPARIN